MQAGKMDQQIEIQERLDTHDADVGEAVKDWVEFASVWAEVEHMSARELVRVRQFSSEITTRFTIRYLPGVNNTMRVVHGSVTYRIVEVIPDRTVSLTLLGYAAQFDA